MKKKGHPSDSSFDNASVLSPPKAQKKENGVHLKTALNALNCCNSGTAICGFTESSSEVLTPETPKKVSNLPVYNVNKEVPSSTNETQEALECYEYFYTDKSQKQKIEEGLMLSLEMLAAPK